MLARVSEALFRTATERPSLGRYQLERRLGEGAFGVVYAAYDPDLDRRVAVKALRPAAGLSDTVRQRFFREARVLGSLLTPEIAAVFDVGSAMAPAELGRSEEDKEVLYIVMEVVDGSNLATWLEAESRSWKEVVQVFRRAGRGLAAAHERGIVHRDFKPSNVLIGAEQTVKVADFGLAQIVDALDSPAPLAEPEQTQRDSEWSGEAHRNTLTKTGVALGTPVFMAPEQHLGERAKPSADQFAFCASLYQALSGEYAFETSRGTNIYEEKRRGAIRPWPSTNVVPLWVRKIIERGLAPDPDDRFPSMDALLDRLAKSPTQRAWSASRWLVVPVVLLGVGAFLVQRFEPGTVAIRGTSDTGTRLQQLQVAVDGDPIETQAGRFEVSPGRHLFEVGAANHEVSARTLDIKPGGDYRIAFDLLRDRGTVDISAAPGAARIHIDGTDHGSRVRDLDIATGSHDIEVRLVDHFSRAFRWQVSRGETRRKHIALTEVGTWSHSAPDLVERVEWVSDLTGDQRDELVVVRAGDVSVLDPWTDVVVHEFRVAHGKESETAIADTDGDGIPELISFSIHDDARRLSAWGLVAGTDVGPRWSVPYPGTPSVRRRLQVLSTPRQPPVLITLGEDSLRGHRARDGVALWSRPTDPSTKLLNAGALLLVADADAVSAIRSDGHPLWTQALEGNTTLVGDVDGDGTSDFSSFDESTPPTLRSGATGEVLVTFPSTDATRVDPLFSDRLAHAYVLIGPAGATLLDARGAQLSRVDGESPKVLAFGRQTYVAVQEDTNTLIRTFEGDTRLELADQEVRRLSIADFNGDGNRELMVRGIDGVLRFFDEDLTRVATIELHRPVHKVWSVRDSNMDGAQDLLFQDNAGVFLVKGPARMWTVRSQAGLRAAPSIVGHGEDLQIVTAIEEAGHRSLARVRGRDGKFVGSPMENAGDLHRAAGLRVHADGADAYFSAQQTVTRYDVASGRVTGLQKLGGHIYATPTVFDADQDGAPEILIGRFGPGRPAGAPNREPTLTVLSADLTRVEATVPLAQYTWSRALPADVDDDGDTDIVVFGLSGGIEAFDPSRQWVRLWQADAGSRINYAGALVGAPGSHAIAATTMSDIGTTDDLVLVRGTNGETLQHHVGWGSRSSAPLGLDGDGDGNVDLYAADTLGNLRRFESDWSTPVWTRRIAAASQGGEPLATAPLIGGSLSAQGPMVVVVASKGGALALVDADSGDVLWRSSVDARVEGHPLLADVDGDGSAELVVATHAGELICFRLGPASWTDVSGPTQPQ